MFHRNKSVVVGKGKFKIPHHPKGRILPIDNPTTGVGGFLGGSYAKKNLLMVKGREPKVNSRSFILGNYRKTRIGKNATRRPIGSGGPGKGQ